MQPTEKEATRMLPNEYEVLVAGQVVETGKMDYKRCDAFGDQNIYKQSKKYPHLFDYFEQGAVILYVDPQGDLRSYTKSESLHLDLWGNYEKTSQQYLDGIKQVLDLANTTLLSRIWIGFGYIGNTKSEMVARQLWDELQKAGLTGWEASIGYREPFYLIKVYKVKGE